MSVEIEDNEDSDKNKINKRKQVVKDEECKNCDSSEFWYIDKNDREYYICIHCGEVFGFDG